MARPEYEITTRCLGGINQNLEKATIDQCADALNVWAPDGAVVQRPGYLGYRAVHLTTYGDGLAPIGPRALQLITEDVSAGAFDVATPYPIGAFAGGCLARTNLSAQVGDRYYCGHASSVFASTISFIRVSTTAANTNTVRGDVEYWNGDTWAPLQCYQASTYQFLTGSNAMFEFVPPKDWAQTTISGVTAYLIRSTFVADGDPLATTVSAGTILDAALGYDGGGALAMANAYYTPAVLSAVAVACPGGRGVVSYATEICQRLSPPVAGWGALTRKVVQELTWATMLDLRTGARVGGYELIRIYNVAQTLTQRNVSSYAPIPELNIVYTCLGKDFPVRVNKIIGAANTDNTIATVEGRDFAVGPGAPWDRATIAQLSEYPRAKFISYFQNRVWVVDKDDILRWSASVPYQDVWPALAFEPLTEVDNSPATGMYPLQEHMVIFKQDSIWVASFTDFDAFEIPHYVPRKIVSGIGTVAHGTIAPLRGELVFLYEDGLYAFDGVGAHKVTIDPKTGADRLEKFFSRVTPGCRNLAVGVNWKQKHTYLLSVAVDGSAYNNAVVAWDYANDAFWLWSGIDAQFWLLTEDEFDNSVLYFIDNYGYSYELGVGNTDHGRRITASVTTTKLGYHDGRKKALTSVELESKNSTVALLIYVARNGRSFTFPEIPLRYCTFVEAGDKMYYPSVGATWAATIGGNFGFEADRSKTLRTLRIGNGDHFQLKIEKQTKAATFHLSSITAGFTTFRGRQ